jgi:hypothetical protein
MMPLATGGGWISRRTASTITKTETANSSSALSAAARISSRR